MLFYFQLLTEVENVPSDVMFVVGPVIAIIEANSASVPTHGSLSTPKSLAYASQIPSAMSFSGHVCCCCCLGLVNLCSGANGNLCTLSSFIDNQFKTGGVVPSTTSTFRCWAALNEASTRTDAPKRCLTRRSGGNLVAGLARSEWTNISILMQPLTASLWSGNDW